MAPLMLPETTTTTRLKSLIIIINLIFITSSMASADADTMGIGGGRDWGRLKQRRLKFNENRMGFMIVH